MSKLPLKEDDKKLNSIRYTLIAWLSTSLTQSETRQVRRHIVACKVIVWRDIFKCRISFESTLLYLRKLLHNIFICFWITTFRTIQMNSRVLFLSHSHWKLYRDILKLSRDLRSTIFNSVMEVEENRKWSGD